MRTEVTAKDKLPDGDIRCFLKCHTPYRLDFLRRAAALRSYPGIRDPALVEAALMAGRQMILFLGLNKKFKGKAGPFLAKDIEYRAIAKNDDRCSEVKIVNLGGDFQDPEGLDTKEQNILAEFVYAADKASAHLTEASNHKLWDDDGEVIKGA